MSVRISWQWLRSMLLSNSGVHPMPIDFKKLLEQGLPQIEDRLWIGTARISERIPGKFCHRHIPAEVLQKLSESIGIHVHLGGEWFRR